MEIPSYAKTSRLPLKTLYWLVSQEIIRTPLTEEDVVGLKMFEKLWGNREMLRTQLAMFSRKRRLVLIESVGIPTKWERYAFSRFRNIEPGKRLAMDQVISEIELTFGFVLKASHIKKLYQIRRKAYNQRYTKNRKNKS
ncbi:MAG: hypothetical protein WBB19_01150 [Desulforhopalus sp.]